MFIIVFFCIFGTGCIKGCWVRGGLVKWIRSTYGKYTNIILKECGIM
jgi:hypothetical protein